MKLRFFFLALLFLAFAEVGFAQRIAIKNNMAYDALLTPNLSVEFQLAPKWSMDIQGGVNSFLHSTDPRSSSYKTSKWSHWMVQPEVRYWSCEVMNGLFFGLHAQGGEMNVGGISLPFILENKDGVMKSHRYEGYFFGVGVSAGYHLMLSNRFSLEFELGVGYNRVMYDKFACVSCGKILDSGQANYLGPTKAAISLVYIIK